LRFVTTEQGDVLPPRTLSEARGGIVNQYWILFWIQSATVTAMTSDNTVDGPPEAPILTDYADGVAQLTLNNPRRKNAITLEMAASSAYFCTRVEHDPAIGAVVIRAAGAYFCSGADTRDLASSSADPASPAAVRRTSAVYSAFVRVGMLPVPTISRVVGGA